MYTSIFDDLVHRRKIAPQKLTMDIAQKDLELIGILVSCFASQLSLKCKSVGENIWESRF